MLVYFAFGNWGLMSSDTCLNGSRLGGVYILASASFVFMLITPGFPGLIYLHQTMAPEYQNRLLLS